MYLITSPYEYVSFLIQNIEDKEVTIPKALYNFFNYIGSGVMYKTILDNEVNVPDLVRYAHRHSLRANDIPNPKAPAKYKYLSSLNSISNFLKKNEKEKDAHWAKQLFKEAIQDITSVRYCNIYQLILDNWDILHCFTGTYELLCAVVCLQADWHDSEEARNELIDIIIKISSEWK